MEKLLFAPITKVDAEKRTVSGYATLETPDKVTPVPDVVDFESAKAAFGAWVGNIREMHLPIAVGKCIEIVPDDTQRGIYITAQLSKSRDGEDAWTKVKEGVLTAFSIGAKGVTRKMEAWKDAGKTTVNRLFMQSLAEVSLVDNPACPGTFFDVVKAATPEGEPPKEEPKPDAEPKKDEPCDDKKADVGPGQRIVDLVSGLIDAQVAKAVKTPGLPPADVPKVTAAVLEHLKTPLAAFANRADVAKLADDIGALRTAVETLTAGLAALQKVEVATKTDVADAKAASADRAGATDVAKLAEGFAKAQVEAEVAKANLADLTRRIEAVERTPLPAKVALRTEHLTRQGLQQADKGEVPEAVKAVEEEIARLEKAIDSEADPRKRDRLGEELGRLRMRIGLV